MVETSSINIDKVMMFSSWTSGRCRHLGRVAIVLVQLWNIGFGVRRASNKAAHNEGEQMPETLDALGDYLLERALRPSPEKDVAFLGAKKLWYLV